MSTLTPAPATPPALSADAERLLGLFRAEPMRWIVLDLVRTSDAAGLSEANLLRAVRELETADLVEHAPYGPLLFIR